MTQQQRLEMQEQLLNSDCSQIRERFSETQNAKIDVLDAAIRSDGFEELLFHINKQKAIARMEKLENEIEQMKNEISFLSNQYRIQGEK